MTVAGSPRLAPHLVRELVTDGSFSENPAEIAAKSNRSFVWQCVNRHRYSMSAAKRTSGRGCPYCANRRVLSGWNDLASRYPALAREWGSDNLVSPSRVAPTSRYEASWTCPDGHLYRMQVVRRTRGLGCTTCSHRKLSTGHNDLATVAPGLASELVGADASIVLAGGHTMMTWRCSLKHTWRASVKTRLSGSGCPYCANAKVLSGFNDLSTLSPSLAAEWSARNTKGPDEVTLGSRYVAIWECAKQHTWKTAVYARKRTGCPTCALAGTSRVEKELFEALSADWAGARHRKRLSIGGKRYEADILWRTVVVEYDGSYFHNNADAVRRDIAKTHAMLNAGYTVVRVREQNNHRLAMLPILHPRLVQLTSEYGEGTLELASRVQAAVHEMENHDEAAV